MATSATRDISITFRPGCPEGVMGFKDRIIHFLDEQCDKYCVAVEQKGDLSTQHFQIAACFKIGKRPNNLKVSLVGMFGDQWSEDQKRHAIFCCKHNDLAALAGGYCHKQDSSPLIKGFTPEELASGAERYEVALEAKDKRNLSRERVIEVLNIINYEFSEHKNPDVRDKWESSSTRIRVGWLFKSAITQGYDMAKYYTPNWINYFINNYDVLFCSGRASDIFDRFLEA